MSLGAIHKLRNAFLLLWDHQSTCSNAFAIILLMNYHTRVWDSKAFSNNPPIPSALRILWKTPMDSTFLVKNKHYYCNRELDLRLRQKNNWQYFIKPQNNSIFGQVSSIIVEQGTIILIPTFQKSRKLSRQLRLFICLFVLFD